MARARNIESMNTLLADTSMKESDALLTQIRKEIGASKQYVTEIREKFKKDIRAYLNQNHNDETLQVNTIYAIVNLLQAVNLNDNLDIIVKPRKMGYEEYADNITANAQWDMKEMDYKKKEFQRDWDSSMFGVGILKKTGWDTTRSMPTIEAMDTMAWLPDPNMDYLTDARYMYFEQEMQRSDLTEENGYKVDKENIEGTITELQETTEYRDALALLNKEPDKDILHVYDGVTYFEGKLYIVTVDAGCNKILRQELVQPVTEIEKETGHVKINTIYNCRWISPRRGNPFGDSIPDLVRDKQLANKALLNLRMLNARYATYGQMTLINTDIIKDTKELTEPSINAKFIGVNAKGGQDMSQIIYPVPRPQIGQDSYAVSNEITRQIQLDTSIDANTMGVGGMGGQQTLGEAQQVQANANLRMSLGIEIGHWAEEEFWEQIWYRSYLEFFGKNDKKIIRVSGNFSSTFIELNHKSFLGNSVIEFTIESKRKIKAIQEGMKASFAAKLPIILQDPNTPEISKKIAQRYAYRLDGMSREMQYLLVPKSVDELMAEEKVEFINEDMDYGAEIDNPDEDHMTFLVIFESARDTKTKKRAIANRKQALIEKKRMEAMQAMMAGQENPAMNAASSASAAQLTNAAIQNNSDPISLNSL